MMTKKERALFAVQKLKEKYPDAVCSLQYQKPYELLIATRLSAQCTDARVNIVTKELFQKFPTLQSFADANIADIEAVVKPCGLYKTKAKSIKEMCTQLIQDFDSTLPDSIEQLTSLSGIGRKTANLIMGDVFHQPAVVVDTHCIRITNRLGLVQGEDPYKLEIALKKEYGINLYNEPRAEGEHGKPFLSYRPSLHYNISHSGKYVVCILADQEVGIDVQIHCRANYERMLRRMVPREQYLEILSDINVKKKFFEQWVLREAYIKWTGEGLSRDMRTISMDEGSHMLLDMEDGYSGAVWAMNPMEINWKYEDIILG